MGLAEHIYNPALRDRGRRTVGARPAWAAQQETVPSSNRMGLIKASLRSRSTYPAQGHHGIKVLPDSCGSLAGFIRQTLRRQQRKGLKGQSRISDELKSSTYISDYKCWPTLYLANKLGFFF